jgi:polyisoprenoid-binding protein YceI
METLKSLKHPIKRNLGKIVTLILAVSLAAFTQNTQAQTAYKILPGSQIKVNGTSNIHDWAMAATGFTCDAQITEQGQDISALTFTLPVKNLKGKEDLLNTRAHKALKAEQHNKITFKLTSATTVPQQKVVKATGQLIIAGVTKEIPVQVSYLENGDEIMFTGSRKLKMSEFKVDPPSFMMGALKVADEVTIHLNLKLKK